jgi:hypothetical protein
VLADQCAGWRWRLLDFLGEVAPCGFLKGCENKGT